MLMMHWLSVLNYLAQEKIDERTIHTGFMASG